MKIGDIVRVVACGSYCEVTEVHNEEAHGDGAGHAWVEILDTGDSATFCLDELEMVNESQ